MAIRQRLTGTSVPPITAANIAGNVADGLTATGATQLTALLITEELNVFTTVAAGSGAILRGDLGPGDEQDAANYGANALLVYPPLGGTMQNGAVNAGFSVAANKTAKFKSRNGLNFTAILST
jgi:hypothetical protein